MAYGLPIGVSVTPDGTATGNAGASAMTLAGDGRYAVFVSAATNLTADTDTNATTDVFRRDLQTGVTELVSVASAGSQTGNGASTVPSVSADGRYVAFQSLATNLIAADGNGFVDVFVRDMTTGVTALVSHVNGGTASANGTSSGPTISADGSTVVYSSGATNLTSVTDGNSINDLFAYIRGTDTNTLITVNSAGTAAATGVAPSSFAVSADGLKVAYISGQTNLTSQTDSNAANDAFIRDRSAGTTTLVSSTKEGGSTANGAASAPTISADGSTVAYVTAATNVTEAVDANAAADVFVWTVAGAENRLVSLDSTGVATAAGASTNPSLSADGRYVAFASLARNFTYSTADNNSVADIYVKDMQTNAIEFVSILDNGTAGTGTASAPTISASGRHVAFISNSIGVSATSDGNGQPDAFVRDRDEKTNYLVSRNSGGTAAGTGGTASAVAINRSGTVTAFLATHTNMIAGDTNASADVAYAVAGASSVVDFAATYRAAENSGAVTVAVTRSAGLGNVSIDYSTSAGTATAGVDYTTATGTLTFAAHEYTKTFTVPLLDDATTELNETINIALSNPSANLVIGSTRPTSIITIEDDESPTISVADTSAVEGSPLTFTISLSGVSGVDTTFAYAAAHANSSSGDLTAASGSATITAGATSTTVTVATTQDSAGEGSETVRLTISDATVGIAIRRIGIGTITDNDTPVNWRMPTSATMERTGASTATGDSRNHVLSSTGRYLLFTSTAPDLTTVSDTNGLPDLFRRDLQTGVTELVSVNAAGTAATAQGVDAGSLRLSPNGNLAAFRSLSTDLVPGTDNNRSLDLFVRDMAASTTKLVSRVSGGTAAGNAGVEANAIGIANGHITYSSSSTDLTATTDSNAAADVFRWDAATDTNVLVSVTTAGAAGNGASTAAVISGSGRYVAFTSLATDLVALTDVNGAARDVFVRDVDLATTKLVSVNQAGTGSGGALSSTPTISDDGRYVAFLSDARDLTTFETRGISQAYRRDVIGDVTQMSSLNVQGSGGGNGVASDARISLDGTRVVVQSVATDLTNDADGNSATDVFVRDHSQGRTTLASSVSNGASTLSSGSTLWSISANNRHVSFLTATNNVTNIADAGNGLDLYIKDTASGITQFASVNTPTSSAGVSIATADLNDDFTVASWSSTATYGLNDNNGMVDIFTNTLNIGGSVAIDVSTQRVAETAPSATVRVRRTNGQGSGTVDYSTSGGTATAGADYTAVSGTLSFAADEFEKSVVIPFIDDAVFDWNETITFTVTNATGSGFVLGSPASQTITIADDEAPTAVLSNVTVTETNATMAVVYTVALDRAAVAATTVTVSTGSGSAVQNDDFTGFTNTIVSFAIGETSKTVTFSVTGDSLAEERETIRIVAVNSSNANIANDTGVITVNDDDTPDIYRLNGRASSRTDDAASGNGATSETVVSGDGTYVAFTSAATNLTSSPDLNRRTDVFRRHLPSGTVELVSMVASNTAASNGESNSPSISSDGRYIAFRSTGSDLSGGGNGYFQIYVRDVQSGVTRLLSTDAAGTGLANGESSLPLISADGSHVAFQTLGNNLTGSDANNQADIYVAATDGSTRQLVSRWSGSATTTANSVSEQHAISADGRYVAMQSNGTNVVAGISDTNNGPDVFLFDRSTGVNTLISIATSGTATGNGVSGSPQLSGDGAVVTFRSIGTNFGPTDGNGNVFDIYFRTAGVTYLASKGPGGVAANALSLNMMISADGRRIVYESNASNVAAGVTDTNSGTDIFVYDRLEDRTYPISVTPAGTATGSSGSSNPNITADGGLVFFASGSNNLTDLSDGSIFSDVFVRSVNGERTQGISRNSAGAPMAGQFNANSSFSARRQQISSDGAVVTFTSGAALASNDVNGSALDAYYASAVGGGSISVQPSVVVNERVSNTALVVNRTPGAVGSLTVDYAIADGTAINGTDFTTTAGGTLTFHPGQNVARIPVALTGDSIAEPNKTFSITLSNVTGVGGSLGNATMTVNVQDDDPLRTALRHNAAAVTNVALSPLDAASADKTVPIAINLDSTRVNGYRFVVGASALSPALQPVTGDLSTGVAAAAFPANRWGFTLTAATTGLRQGALNNGDYVGFPTTPANALVASTAASDSSTLTARVKIDYLVPAGTYTSNVTLQGAPN